MARKKATTIPVTYKLSPEINDLIDVMSAALGQTRSKFLEEAIISMANQETVQARFKERIERTLSHLDKRAAEISEEQRAKNT